MSWMRVGGEGVVLMVTMACFQQIMWSSLKALKSQHLRLNQCIRRYSMGLDWMIKRWSVKQQMNTFLFCCTSRLWQLYDPQAFSQTLKTGCPGGMFSHKILWISSKKLWSSPGCLDTTLAKTLVTNTLIDHFHTPDVSKLSVSWYMIVSDNLSIVW